MIRFKEGDVVMLDPHANTSLDVVEPVTIARVDLGEDITYPYLVEQGLDSDWVEEHGVEFDKDSGELHEVHEVWNALAALELKLREDECQT